MDNQLESAVNTAPFIPLLIIISGPSGVGKDAVVSRMRCQNLSYHFIVTATTRPKRPQERNNIDYQFLSTEEFQLRLEKGAFLEHAQVYGNLYGVPRAEVIAALNQGNDVILKTDVQGAATLKKLVPEAVFIFLCASSLKELETRLSKRHTETPKSIEYRLRAARTEMEESLMFDHTVVNRDGHINETTQRVNEIISAEHRRIPPRIINL